MVDVAIVGGGAEARAGASSHHAGDGSLRSGLRHCAKECESCLSHCTQLLVEGKKEHALTLRSCNDCGDMCILAGKLVVRDGAFADVDVRRLLPRPVMVAGPECGKFPNDEHMSLCAQACKDCATACRAMVKADGGAE